MKRKPYSLDEQLLALLDSHGGDIDAATLDLAARGVLGRDRIALAAMILNAIDRKAARP
ncbi:MAG: hypothetical protein VW405_20745 [Rhodospirillaceae bacterium]